MDQLLQYATNRIIELESLLLVDIQETVWPTEVKMVFLRLITPGISRLTTNGAYCITLTGCGWRKCRKATRFLRRVNPARLLLHSGKDSVDVHKT